MAKKTEKRDIKRNDTVPKRLPKDASYEERFEALCKRLEVPDGPPIFRRALIGEKLALEQPEFTSLGRPRGTRGKEGDSEILDLIEFVMKEWPGIFDFEDILDAVVEKAIKREKLKADVDPRTHPNRLRRLWDWRRENDSTLSAALLYSRRQRGTDAT
jgi:hypothetical protein